MNLKEDKKELLRRIPKLDKFVELDNFKNYSKKLIIKISKNKIEELRENILKNKIENFSNEELIQTILKEYKKKTKSSLKNVINATGVIIHTNLGRSLIYKKNFNKAKKIATSYNNLEYNLEEGRRGERYSHLVDTLKNITSCEDAVIVNNNASAVFLILNTFAKNKEAIVSRGELVEIGGSFRIPEVMNQSGAILKEIGTTNKTHLVDYEKAINQNSAIMMKVHKSNYSIEGFFSEVELKDIIELAKNHNIIDYFDMGSGHIVDLPNNLDKKEPSILEYMKHNPSLLSFSGDKLLGSVQAGIIVGKKELIAKIKKNQLLRMLRVDKITLSLLQEDLNLYLKGKQNKIPTIKMLNTKLEKLEKRANKVKTNIEDICKCEVIKSSTIIGGGTTPNMKIPTICLSLEHKNLKPNNLEKLLRAKNIIARVQNNKLLLDFKTIQKDELSKLIKRVKKIFNDLQ